MALASDIASSVDRPLGSRLPRVELLLFCAAGLPSPRGRMLQHVDNSGISIVGTARTNTLSFQHGSHRTGLADLGRTGLHIHKHAHGFRLFFTTETYLDQSP